MRNIFNLFIHTEIIYQGVAWISLPEITVIVLLLHYFLHIHNFAIWLQQRIVRELYNVMLQIKNSKNIVDRCNLSNSQVAKQKCIDVISVILASFRFTT